MKSKITMTITVKKNAHPYGKSDCLFWINTFCKSLSFELIDVLSADYKNSFLKAYEISKIGLGKYTIHKSLCVTYITRECCLKNNIPYVYYGYFYLGKYCNI